MNKSLKAIKKANSFFKFMTVLDVVKKITVGIIIFDILKSLYLLAKPYLKKS